MELTGPARLIPNISSVIPIGTHVSLVLTRSAEGAAQDRRTRCRFWSRHESSVRGVSAVVLRHFNTVSHHGYRSIRDAWPPSVQGLRLEALG
jgi:hypothetical protein